MTTIVHIMLDLETWGTEPGCDIRSIGACVFDPLTGAVNTIDGEEHPSHFYIACDNPYSGMAPERPNPDRCRKYPLTRDPRTVQWWSEQSDEAQAAFANPVDLRTALSMFHIWVHHLLGAYDDGNAHLIDLNRLRIWSHGPAFDTPILAAAYKAVGLPVPWHYRAPRDTRTAFDMVGVDDHSAWLRQFDTGTFHHALHDAISQAKAVCAAYERLRLPHDVRTHRGAWRRIIAETCVRTNDDNGTGYYSHELKAFDRTFELLNAFPHHG